MPRRKRSGRFRCGVDRSDPQDLPAGCVRVVFGCVVYLDGKIATKGLQIVKPTRGFEPRTPSLRGTPRFESCAQIPLNQAEIECRACPLVTSFCRGVRPWCDLERPWEQIWSAAPLGDRAGGRRALATSWSSSSSWCSRRPLWPSSGSRPKAPNANITTAGDALWRSGRSHLRSRLSACTLSGAQQPRSPVSR